MDIHDILTERATTHGDYIQTAAVSRAIKDALALGHRHDFLFPHEIETVDMIANKLARIVCGNPHFPDHWDDIAGYATLTADLIRERGK